MHNTIRKELFLFYSRPLFRTCEIICNHAARFSSSKQKLASEDVRSELAGLNETRRQLQRDLKHINDSYPEVCADCKGHCCGGNRERDAFIDRIIQCPDTGHLRARRKSGCMPCMEGVVTDPDARCVEGFCPELTTRGCLVPYERRPIQCTAYFCRRLANSMSEADLGLGMHALIGLMSVQVRTVLLMLRG